MKLTFLGTGTSMGVPIAGGFSYDGLSTDSRDYRSRVSAWIQSDEASVLIDIGPDFREQSIRSGIKHIDLLLITHEHTDHIAGLDDLRPFNYISQKPIPVYCTESCEMAIKHRFFYMFEPNKTPGSVSLEFQETKYYQTKTFKDLEITPIPVMHGSLPIMGFKINDLAYMTDVSHLYEQSINQLKGIDTLVISALRMSPKHPTHYTIPEVLEVIESVDPKRAFIIHMNSQVRQEREKIHLPENVHFAFDLLTLEI